MAEADNMTTTPPENSSSMVAGRHEAAIFECNICFDIAQDPMVTICGHLHCWPCLYKWLNLHSQCPVCNTLIEQDNLIPLYGRGNTPIDPTLISLRNDEIPRRPARRRPDTTPPPSPEANDLADTTPAALSHFGLSAGMLSPVLRVRFHQVSDAWGFNYGDIGEGNDVVDRESSNGESFKKILVFILLFVLFDFLTI